MIDIYFIMFTIDVNMYLYNIHVNQSINKSLFVHVWFLLIPIGHKLLMLLQLSTNIVSLGYTFPRLEYIIGT